MTVKQKQLDEKIQTGGGATGVSHTADPVAKNATLPASHLGNGEKMNTIAHIAPGEGEEETSTENNVKTTKDTAGSNKASVGMKGSAATPGQSYSFAPNSVKEDVEAMFAGSELSEEFKEKAAVIFEAAVTAQVNEAVADLEEQYNTALAEELAKIFEDLTDKIDQYMTYTVEQWMEENQVAIEHSLRTEITEEFITNLKSLFEQSYISIPEEKFDVVEGMTAEMEEMKAELDKAIEENMELKNALIESSRKEIIAQVSEGLAATQSEKLVALAEGVEFDSLENYRKKLEIVKENYFPTDKPASAKQNLLEQINEENVEPAKATVNSPVSAYAQAISRTVKK
jgi:hypothetical protein